MSSLNKAFEQVAANDALLVAIHTLAVEYEAKTITAERFAQRVVALLARRFAAEASPVESK